MTGLLEKIYFSVKNGIDTIEKLTSYGYSSRYLEEALNRLVEMGCLEHKRGVYSVREDYPCPILNTPPSSQPLPPSPKSDVSQPSRIVLALLSDIHVGRRTSSFNVKILEQRVKNYVNAISKIANEYPSKVVLLGLGDYVDGANIYPKQSYEQEMPPNEQVAVGLNLLSELLEITDHFYGIVGNHGKTSDDETGNYDYFLLLSIKSKLNNKAIVSPRHNEYFKLPNKQVILASHPPPPRIYTYQGIPDYGIKRFVMSHVSANRDLSEAYFGHFHTVKFSYDPIPIVLNGTFLTDDELAKTMGFTSIASQLVVLKQDKTNNYMVLRL